jgi:hypothetical protein
MLVPSSAYLQPKNMEAVRSFETSIKFYWTTRRHILEDSYRCENLKSNMFKLLKNERVIKCNKLLLKRWVSKTALNVSVL